MLYGSTLLGVGTLGVEEDKPGGYSQAAGDRPLVYDDGHSKVYAVKGFKSASTMQMTLCMTYCVWQQASERCGRWCMTSASAAR